ncbi:FGGY-family carbohydrate kinase [Planctomycetota bacterium]
MAGNECFIGVDVGTAGVRAGVFNKTGNMLASAAAELKIFKPRDDFVEQSSDDIWSNACRVIKQAVAQAGIAAADVAGIGFDATCSLVALDRDDAPVTVSPSGNPEQNIIMWMDHRALAEAEEINGTNDEVLAYVGGKISPEMEIPKLLWLKRNLRASYDKTAKFFDLADYMVYRAGGRDIRSVCTKVCKWTYLAHEKRWSEALFRQLNLEDLSAGGRIGGEIRDLGAAAGKLCPPAADEMGLATNTVVAVGIIDAHAGGVGIIGAEPEHTLALIGGTSSCHMAVSKEPLFVKGVWGPYYGAMLPGYWLNEGGQSATGALLEHIVQDSEIYRQFEKELKADKRTVYELLNEEVEKIRAQDPYPTRDYHVLGYFHGNRSPRANPNLKGLISGLSLNRSKRELAKKYLATIQAIAYGTRHIIKTLNAGGHRINRIHMCGGGTKNPLWLAEHADICDCEIVLPKEPEAVLLGSAILAAAGSGVFNGIFEAIKAMTGTAEVYQPLAEHREFHNRKYKVFLEMHNDQVKYGQMLE